MCYGFIVCDSSATYGQQRIQSCIKLKKKKKTGKTVWDWSQCLGGLGGDWAGTHPHLLSTRLAGLFEIRSTFNCFNLIIKPFLNLMNAVFMCFQIWP